ncbi:MAG: hypothetical protein ABIS18_10480 [Actinomycetota bacterium]
MRRRKLIICVLTLVSLVASIFAAFAENKDLHEALVEVRQEATHQLAHPGGLRMFDRQEKLEPHYALEGVVGLGAPEPKTLYFHSVNNLMLVDEANEFAGGQGPFMDANPPSSLIPKIATMGQGNQDYRKNFLLAYWGGLVNGVVAGDPKVTFWLQSPAALNVEVSLFGDGGSGVATPFARKTIDVLALAPTRIDVVFAGVVAPIEKEVVVQMVARTAGAATNASILFDSTEFPSSFSFTLAALPDVPLLDDPLGIAYRGTDLIAANSGTGHLVKVDGGLPSLTLARGFPQGGFTRGVTGVAVDGSGNLYAAVADTGEIVFLTPSGQTGVYARGLGVPVGIAFDPTGNLFIADSAGKRILKIAPDRSITTVHASNFRPYGLAFAPDGTLAVSSLRDGAVYFVNVNDPNAPSAATTITGGAEGLAYAASGTLYIGSNSGAGTDAKGRVLRMGGSGVVAATKLGGPINLAFQPGTNNLTVASQADGLTSGDAIKNVDVGEPGLPLAAPNLAPTDLGLSPRVWVHKANAQAIDPANVLGPLAEADSRYVGRDGTEPTMGVQNDGDIYTVASSFGDSATKVTARPQLFRSPDDGLSWQQINPKLPMDVYDDPPTTADPYVWVDQTTDRVFSAELIGACQYLNWSDNDGQNWTTNRLGCGQPPVDHQTFAGGPPRVSQTNGYPNMLYHCSNWVSHSPCGRSFDGGKSWSPAGVAFLGVDPNQPPTASRPLSWQCGGLTGHVIVDPEGRVVLAKGQCGIPSVSVSEDDGLTWTQYAVSTTIKQYTHESIVASDTAGNLYYAYMDSRRLPHLSVSTDHGRTWSTPKMVAPPGVTEAHFASIDARAPGSVAILYMGTTSDYGYTARNYTKTSWNGYLTVSINALADDPTFQSTTANPLRDPLFRGDCNSRPCGLTYDFLDIVIAPDGRAWGTFVDSCTGPCVANRSAAATDGEVLVAPLVIGPNLKTGGALVSLKQ